MRCQANAGAPDSHTGEREAATLLVFPTGMQEPACDDCARYWVNLRPADIRLAPLSSYADYYEVAQANLRAGDPGERGQGGPGAAGLAGCIPAPLPRGAAAPVRGWDANRPGHGRAQNYGEPVY